MNLRDFMRQRPDPSDNEIDLGRLRVLDVMATGEDDNLLLGTTRIFGVNHHVALVRVHEVDGEQVAVSDPLDIYQTIKQAAVAMGKLNPIEIPTLEGEWLICITPYESDE